MKEPEGRGVKVQRRAMMEQIYKYPRTRHLEGSRKQLGDEDMKCVKYREIQGKYMVLDE